MQGLMKPFVRVLAVGVSLLLMESGLTLLRAQEGAATIAGTVLDQVGKPIGAASVTAKSDSASFSRAATTDTESHFSVAGLTAGTYTVETSAPGFALSSRRGVPSGTQNVAITLFVDAISQSVTVQVGVASLGYGSAREYARCDFRQNGDQQRRNSKLYGAGRRLRGGHSAGAGRVQPQSERNRPRAG